VAREMPDHHFYILGSATSTSKKVLGALNEKIEEYGLENVEVRSNVPRGELKSILSRAMFYLHPPYPEHFGLSVAEAVAAGAIPIVYRDGGAWTDIVSRIDPGLGYHDIGEVPKIVRELEGRPDFLNELRERGENIVKDFTYDRFKERLAGIIKMFEGRS
jgi:glycosyltransferase involved in cell wall biosynthesis